MASSFGGLCCALVASPTELVKCRLQAQGSPDAALARFKVWEASGRMGVAPTVYKGPGDVVRYMMQKEGGLRSLGTGLGTAALRDGLGCAALFAMYEGVKDVIVQQQVRWHVLHAFESRSSAPSRARLRFAICRWCCVVMDKEPRCRLR